MKRENLKIMIRSAYDMQSLRVQVGNRIATNFKVKLGQGVSEKEDTIDAEGKQILINLRNAHKRITDGVTKEFVKLKDLPYDKVISDYGELHLVGYYLSLVKAEETLFKAIEETLTECPIWTEYLEGVKGIGRAMAGVIISEFDIHKAESPSSLWAYAGLDVAADGAGRSRRKEHLRDIEYINKKGKPATRKGLTFNPFLKTKLLGVLTASFIKDVKWENCDEETYDASPEDRRKVNKKGIRQILGYEGPWRIVYQDYKHRLENHSKHGVHNDKVKSGKVSEDGTELMLASKGHRHNMAMRYMIKMFLIELYTKWRPLEGLEVSKPYHEAKLGMQPHKRMIFHPILKEMRD